MINRVVIIRQGDALPAMWYVYKCTKKIRKPEAKELCISRVINLNDIHTKVLEMTWSMSMLK